MTNQLPALDVDEAVIDDHYDDEEEALADAVAAAHHILTADEKDDLDLAFGGSARAGWYDA